MHQLFCSRCPARHAEAMRRRVGSVRAAAFSLTLRTAKRLQRLRANGQQILQHGLVLLRAKVSPAGHFGDDGSQPRSVEPGDFRQGMALDAAVQQQRAALGQDARVALFVPAGAEKRCGDRRRGRTQIRLAASEENGAERGKNRSAKTADHPRTRTRRWFGLGDQVRHRRASPARGR
jgi:hypothetical protein